MTTHLMAPDGLPACGASVVAEDTPVGMSQLPQRVDCGKCLHPSSGALA